MPPVEFEPTIPASERPQTHALDRAATGIGVSIGANEKKHTNPRLRRYRILIVLFHYIDKVNQKTTAPQCGQQGSRKGKRTIQFNPLTPNDIYIYIYIYIYMP
jgi:hypothetical protein